MILKKKNGITLPNKLSHWLELSVEGIKQLYHTITLMTLSRNVPLLLLFYIFQFVLKKIYFRHEICASLKISKGKRQVLF